MNVLVVDVGGTNVKVLATGQDEPRRFPSGPTLTAAQMVAGVKEPTGEWPYDGVSIGYPGLIHEGRIVAEPRNLASGWVGFDFAAAFGDYVGRRGLKRLGKKKWRQHVAYGVERLIAALYPDDVVLGGGNAKKLQEIPPGCRVGDNAKAFLGGLRLWGEEGTTEQTPMTAARLLLTSRPAWKALAAHAGHARQARGALRACRLHSGYNMEY